MKTWRTTKAKRHDRIISPRMVQAVFVTLKAALSQARKWRLIHVNPCELLDPPRRGHREMRALSAEQAREYIAAFAPSPIGLMVFFTLASGVRRGELLGLKRGDFSADSRAVTVQHALESVRGILNFKPPKTMRSRRTIVLPASIIAPLHQHMLAQSERFLALGFGRASDDAPLFDNINGKHWNPDTFTATYLRLLRGTHLEPKVNFHALRHSYASMALSMGLDLETISAALGHSAIAITADTYLHVTRALTEEAAQKMDSIFTRFAPTQVPKSIRTRSICGPGTEIDLSIGP